MCLAQNPEQFAMYPLRVYRRILNNSLCAPYVFVTESSTIRYVCVCITESSTIRYVSHMCLSQDLEEFAMYPLCVYHRILNNSLCIPFVFITESSAIRYVPPMCLSQNPQQFVMYPLCVYHRIANNSLCTPDVFTTESSTIRHVPRMWWPLRVSPLC